MTLTISDLLTFIGINLAVIALFCGIIIFYLQSQKKQIIEDVKEIKRNSFIISEMSFWGLECIMRIRNENLLQNSLIKRIVKQVPISQSQLEIIDKIFLENDFSIDKAIQMLITFTENNERRDSALKQIAERFGDADILDKLIELKKHEKLYQKQIQFAIDKLKERINRSLAITY